MDCLFAKPPSIPPRSVSVCRSTPYLHSVNMKESHSRALGPRRAARTSGRRRPRPSPPLEVPLQQAKGTPRSTRLLAPLVARLLKTVAAALPSAVLRPRSLVDRLQWPEETTGEIVFVQDELLPKDTDETILSIRLTSSRFTSHAIYAKVRPVLTPQILITSRLSRRSTSTLPLKTSLQPPVS